MSRRATGMSSALQPAAEGLLVDVAERVAGSGGESAFALVVAGDTALKARLALIDSAHTSLDIKYFIWKADPSGQLLFTRLLAAAQRGVRVRLLIDDLNLPVSDDELAAIDLHDNIAINLWNPPKRRSIIGGLSEFAISFDDLNKRMHNKMILADGVVGLFGGRNVADEYFGLTRKYNFLDLDVLAAGPIVHDVSASFDEYWASPLSVSVSELVDVGEIADLADTIAADERALREHADLLEPFGLTVVDWTDWFDGHLDHWHRGNGIYLQDDPVHAQDETERLLDYLEAQGIQPESELDYVSAYLIPDHRLLANIRLDTERGIRVRVVTGTQESINHTPAYAHYRGDIERILDTGAELYEIDGQPSEEVRRAANTPPHAGKYVAIHLKGLLADRRYAFLGSLNLDPRAMDINTEGGLLIDSPGLGAELGELIDTLTAPENGWRVERTDDGSLRWTGKGVTRSGSPNRGTIQRVLANVFEFLPIRSQL